MKENCYPLRQRHCVTKSPSTDGPGTGVSTAGGPEKRRPTSEVTAAAQLKTGGQSFGTKKKLTKSITVLSAKSASDVMFCLQSYQGLRSIDHACINPIRRIGLIHK